MLENIQFTPIMPVRIPQSFSIRLDQFIGSREISDCPWVALSLVHPTYLNEHLRDFDKAGI